MSWLLLINFCYILNVKCWTFNADAWINNKIEYNHSLSQSILSINNHIFCYTDTKMYLFGGRTNEAMPTDYTSILYYIIVLIYVISGILLDVKIMDADTEQITEQNWTLWEDPAPSAPIYAYPNQVGCVSNGIYALFARYELSVFCILTYIYLIMYVIYY